jgi:muramoyltetrapeptide carboxypeptidase
MTFRPPSLKQGATIGIIAPSSYYDKEEFSASIALIEKRGYKIVFHEQVDSKHNQFAGTPEEKITALHDYFKDPNIDAIFTLVGGNGALHLLDKIDYTLIKQNSKILMGFSDITALLNALSSQIGLVTYHGPTIASFSKIAPEDIDQCFDLLTNQTLNAPIPTNIHTEGLLYGGNLSVLQALIGTDYAPPVDQDLILFIEDTNDHLSRYDRMIAHMKLAGWFKNVKAILIGEFLKSQDNPERPFGMTIEEIVKTHVPDVPVISDLPIGHGERLITLPIGAKVLLKNGCLSYKST